MASFLVANSVGSEPTPMQMGKGASFASWQNKGALTKRVRQGESVALEMDDYLKTSPGHKWERALFCFLSAWQHEDRSICLGKGKFAPTAVAPLTLP